MLGWDKTVEICHSWGPSGTSGDNFTVMRNPPSWEDEQAPGLRFAVELVLALPQVENCVRSFGVPMQEVADLTGDTVLLAWQLRERYQPRRGPFVPWVLAIARNIARNARKRLRREGIALDPERCAGPDDANPYERLRAKEVRALLEHLLAPLPPEQRAVIEAHHLRGRSFAEIAEEQGAGLETTRKRERLGWGRLTLGAQSHRARRRHKGEETLPMLLPLLPRRSGAVKPFLAAAFAGAAVMTVMLVSPEALRPTSASAPSATPMAAMAPVTAPPAAPPEPEPARVVESGPRAVSGAPEGQRARRGDGNQGLGDVQLLRRALELVRAGRAEEALQLLKEHERRYPGSQYAPDMAVIRRRIEELRRGKGR